MAGLASGRDWQRSNSVPMPSGAQEGQRKRHGAPMLRLSAGESGPRSRGGKGGGGALA